MNSIMNSALAVMEVVSSSNEVKSTQVSDTLNQSKKTVAKRNIPSDFVPLDKETRSHVSTNVMSYHMGRRPQTARIWACKENGPLRPIHINGRLAWSVVEIKRLLGV